MTYTPDRKRRKSNRRARRTDSGSRSDAGNRPKIGPSDTTPDLPSLREQLRAAGLDLTGHPFAEVFDALDPVPTEPLESAAADAGNTADEDAGSPPWSEETENGTITPGPPTDPGDNEPAWEDDEPARKEASDDAAAAQRTSRHPLLPDTTWSDLADCAPEITDAITSLTGLDEKLRTFDRPMGPNEALHVIDGAEALRRLSDSLSTLALSVYERVGTPTDSGAKTPKDLIQSRLNLTGREANRRARLAESLGGRVTLDGQRLEPEHPLVAEQFHLGTLSAEHITALEECLKALPAWVDQATKDKAEADLVRYAADVTVNELRDIFRHMLVRIDPDGAEPLDAKERSAYFVTARPKRNGDWRLEGVLDPVAGAELHGLLTSRIESARPAAGDPSTDPALTTAGPAPTTADPAPSGSTPAADSDSGATVGPDHNRDEERYAPVDAVLAGDRLDAPQWAVFEANRDSGASQNPVDAATALPDGYGVREDGSTINLVREQPTAKSWIYERFATLISRISMKEAQKGSPYALVVTAKASDLANNIGEATTGSGARFPMDDLARRGLNGTVFFHLMDEIARTVEVRTENRFANKKQTAVITARDRGCVFPGCDAPAGWCDVNHVVPHSEGGRTDINNMCLVCSHHHHLMDRSGWEVVMLPDGRPAWKPPESIDPTRALVLHSRFITDDIIDGLFDF
ncbi:HNH endonuclease signature motif containing protein [Brevibacterium atlanticum]|uniref:HNH endonuclease signature motif containing protein n=1 Tax=Brevibacterium atlanticum TaxID=2697563 RepID=UPI00141F559A|nr:HNH endonuclease signature motif containing protein [Brevibacterium atlanticum]